MEIAGETSLCCKDRLSSCTHLNFTSSTCVTLRTFVHMLSWSRTLCKQPQSLFLDELVKALECLTICIRVNVFRCTSNVEFYYVKAILSSLALPPAALIGPHSLSEPLFFFYMYGVLHTPNHTRDSNCILQISYYVIPQQHRQMC